MMKKILNAVVVSALIVSALCAGYMFIARFFDLQAGPLYDELYSMATANPRHPFVYLWKEILLNDINPPLYNVLLFLWNKFFPFEIQWVRLFSVLPGVAAVLVSYVLAPQKWPRLKKFILTAFVACSVPLTFTSTLIRSYALGTLLIFIFTFVAMRLVEDFAKHQKPARSRWLVFFLTGLAASYSHFFPAGLFFISALVVFLYACYYKIGRGISFWGTAATFALWTPWLIHTYLVMSAPTGSWWYSYPLAHATWDIATFLFGALGIMQLLVAVGVIGMVSYISLHKEKILQVDFMLPLAQVVLLIAVVAAVSLKYNLWLDRYFSFLLPAFFLLLTELFFRLQERHKILIVLLPILLGLFVADFIHRRHQSSGYLLGFKEAFAYIDKNFSARTVLIDYTNTGYPDAALQIMFEHYLPQGSNLQIKELSHENVLSAFQEPKPAVLLPLCTGVHILYSSFEYGMEEDQHPAVFGRDVCVMTVHQVPSEAQIRQKLKERVAQNAAQQIL